MPPRPAQSCSASSSDCSPPKHLREVRMNIRASGVAPRGFTELGSLRAAMLGLISTPDPRYGGAPDPDEERERRWEPINWRISVSMTVSLLCLIVSGATPLAATIALNLAAIAPCVYAARLAWPPRRPDAPDDDA